VIDWLGALFAGAALVLSALVAHDSYRSRGRASRTANVTAYFHRVSEFARVVATDGTSWRAGYHLVVWNQGPSAATGIRVDIRDAKGDPVPLADFAPDELPLPRLDPAGRYPIPWLPTGEEQRAQRRFEVTVTWSDGNGTHEHVVPLRRGQTSL
jgi:hypothetical protein